MLQDIVHVEYVDNYRLYLCFEDGIEGTVDLFEHIHFSRVLAPLADQNYFAQVRVNPEIGTICWPNGADIDPDVLYAIGLGRAHRPR
jgi:hypothetical protein